MPPVTKALLLVLVGFYCLGVLVPGLQYWLALHPWVSAQWAPWQLISYGLLHGSEVHLFFNLLGLWIFGSELERSWGGRRYLSVLMVSLLTAALVQLLMGYALGWRQLTVGASGALYGLLLSYGLQWPDRIIMPLIPPIPMRAQVAVAIFGLLELIMGLTGGTGIAHFAHLGGMLGAYLLMQYWRHGRRR